DRQGAEGERGAREGVLGAARAREQGSEEVPPGGFSEDHDAVRRRPRGQVHRRRARGNHGAQRPPTPLSHNLAQEARRLDRLPLQVSRRERQRRCSRRWRFGVESNGGSRGGRGGGGGGDGPRGFLL
ncbi:unnamed protein product, partial [Laminaria digitata]